MLFRLCMLLKKQAGYPPLANFAQLSMFRFDGLTIAKAIIAVNRQNDIYNHLSDKCMIVKVIFFI